MEYVMLFMTSFITVSIAWIALSMSSISDHLADLKSIIEEATVEDEED
jgi:hypothetical protein